MKSFNLNLWIAATSALLVVASFALQADPLVTYPLRMKKYEVRVELANTDESRQRGLMYRERLAENSGMIFVFPRKEASAMWMKNTRVPLSVAFIDELGRILNIAEMEPFSERVHGSAGEALFALEMNRGWFTSRGIKAGDRIEGLAKLPRGQ